MEPLNEWKGKFGDEYTKRNVYDHRLREKGFQVIIPKDVHYILEVGCNRGINLSTLDSLGYSSIGVEPNYSALKEGVNPALKRRIVLGEAQNLPFANNSFDLVFTCGVLIHIPPKQLSKVLDEIRRVSRKYILAIEYKGNEKVEYRGHKTLLWKRPSYEYSAEIISEGQLGKEFDDCYYWLFNKGG